MQLRQFVILSVALCILSIGVPSYANWWPFGGKDDKATQTELTEITWDDLIPVDFVQPENPFATMSQEKIDQLLDGSAESEAELQKLQEAFNYAPVVDELDGKRVKIPAYVTPLDFDGNTRLSEFLLVPYMGACMHTPPPPANQVVHAKAQETITIKSMYEPVWAIGTINTETVKSNLAEAGYRLTVEEVVPYTTSQQ